MSELKPTVPEELTQEQRIDSVVDSTRNEIFDEIHDLREVTEQSENDSSVLESDDLRQRYLQDEANRARIKELNTRWAALGGEKLDAAIKNLEDPDEYGESVARLDLSSAKRHMYETIRDRELDDLMRTAEELQVFEESGRKLDERDDKLNEKFNQYAEKFGLSQEEKDELMEKVAQASGYSEPQPAQPANPGESQPTAEEVAAALSGEEQSPEDTPEGDPKVRELEAELAATKAELAATRELVGNLKTTVDQLQETIREQGDKMAEAMSQMRAEQTALLERLENRGAQPAVSPADLNPAAPAQPFSPLPNFAPNTQHESGQEKSSGWRRVLKNVKTFGRGEKDPLNNQELTPRDRGSRKLGRAISLFSAMDELYMQTGERVPKVHAYEGLSLQDWMTQTFRSTDARNLEPIVARLGGKKSIRLITNTDNRVTGIRIAGEKVNDAQALWALSPFVNRQLSTRPQPVSNAQRVR